MKEVPEGWVRIRGIPEMTPDMKAELETIASSERPIDYSDIPELDERFWKYGFRSPRHAVNRPQLQVRLEPDVSAWIDSSDENVHAHVSAIVREAMQRAQAEAASADDQAAHPAAAE